MSAPAPSATPAHPRVLREPSAFARYGAALLLTVAAVALSIPLRGFLATNVFIFFFAAVVLAAWYGGTGPALLVTALALPLVNFFVIQPTFAFALTPLAFLRMAVFVLVSVLIGRMRASLDAVRREAEAAAAAAQDQAVEVEMQAEELQAQAAELEQQTEEARALAEELERAHLLLAESMERQLAEAQAVAHLGSWEWEVDGGEVRWSDEMFRIYGLEPGAEAVTLRGFVERVHPDDRERVITVVRTAVETLQPFEFDHRIVRPDGAVRILHARGRVEAGGDGRARRMVGTGQDVTEARQAEDAALALAAERAARATAEGARERMERLLENVGDAFVAVDHDWRYQFVNRRAEETLGRPRAELLGRSLWEIFPDAAGGPAEAELRRALEEGVPHVFEFYSTVLEREIAVRAFPGEDGLSIFYHDVTARRRVERQLARLAAIVESSDDAIFSKSLEGIVESWNRGAERLYGYTAEEIVGRPVRTLAPPDRLDEFPLILETVARGGHVEALETVRRRKDGALVEVQLTVSPLRDADGAVVGASTIARDITARRRTEAALRESEARYRRLIDTAHEGIWLVDPAGRTTYLNGRMAAMLGTDAATAAGRPLADHVHPDDREAVVRALAAGDEGSGPARLDARLRRGDGSDLWATLSLSPLTDDAGRPAGALAMVTDVSERRRAEESLRFLAEASRVLAASLDYRATLASVVRLAVPRLADFCALGLVEEEGGPARPVAVAHVDPAREEVLRRLAEAEPPRPGDSSPASRALVTGEPVLLEEIPGGMLEDAVAAEARGEVAALAVRSALAVPLHGERGVIGVLALGLSDSGRRYGPDDLALAEEVARRAATAVENARLHQSERRARRAAERAAERIARLQAVTAALSNARTPAEVADVVIQQGLAALGAAAGWLVQLTPDGGALEAVRTQGYDGAVEESFRRFTLDAPVPLADAVRTGEPVFLESPAERFRRYPALQRDYGYLENGAWASVPLLLEGRAVGGIGLTFREARAFNDEERDFVLALARQSAQALERARLYEAERGARAEAEAANRAKFDFLTTMSHELRTPLNAIAGYVELLELEIRGPLTDAQRQDLERIHRSQKHLLGLINDVLNFARIETGHVHFDVRDVPLHDALGEVEPLISPQVRSKGLAYEFVPLDPAVTVRADGEKVRQIVLNLLSNAVKFTAPGGRITLEARAVDAIVEVRVRDTGIGIPADKLTTIFEPFVQVNAGYTRTQEGTGLGLAISRDLARAMGGELVAESVEGEGSVFILTLPRGMAGGT
ncbi:MAG TPA: PAS domain S-box protein [Longimicrobium sp.]|nr:PAS domain S-box protein [Longimicrobium sp.]